MLGWRLDEAEEKWRGGKGRIIVDDGRAASASASASCKLYDEVWTRIMVEKKAEVLHRSAMMTDGLV